MSGLIELNVHSELGGTAEPRKRSFFCSIGRGYKVNYVNTMPHPGGLEDRVETFVDEYETLDPLRVRQETHRLFSEPPDDIESTTLEISGIQAGDNVLDVGCGTGSFLSILRSKEHRGALCAVDLSFAATRSASGISGVLAVQGDACAIPFVDSFFGVVFARHMLYHVYDLPAALREIKRVLMPRGKFVSVVNLPQQAPRVAEMLIRHTERHGVAVPVQPQVDSQSLPNYLATYFRKVSAYEFTGKLVFRSPEPLIAFAQSLLAFYGISLHSALRSRIISAIAEEVENWFEGSDKPWEDKKGYTIFTAQRHR